MTNTADEVIVTIGAGSIGTAIARRQGSGKTVVLADVDELALNRATSALEREGYVVHARLVDVSSREQVEDLAQEAAEMGRVVQVVHAAGLSPSRASARAILEVDLLGVGLVLESLGAVIASGGAGVVVASMAGHLSAPLTAAQETTLANVWAEELLRIPFTDPDYVTDSRLAYGLAQRAKRILVEAAGVRWGRRGARINSISVGVISQAGGPGDRSGDPGIMREIVESSGTGRIGTHDDVATAAAFLLSSQSTFVTGTDLLVDGGAVGALRTGQLRFDDCSTTA